MMIKAYGLLSLKMFIFGWVLKTICQLLSFVSDAEPEKRIIIRPICLVFDQTKTTIKVHIQSFR